MDIIQDKQSSYKELWSFTILLILATYLVMAVSPWIEPDMSKKAANDWYRSRAYSIVTIPFFSALICVAFFQGKAGVLRLYTRLVDWKIGLKWWLIALFIPVGIHSATAVIIHLFFDANVWHESFLTTVGIYIVALSWLFPLFVFEELAWRGYLQPSLQARYTPFKSSLIVSLVWLLWHLPIWYGLILGLTGTPALALAFALAGILVLIGMSLIMTFLLNNVRASILIAMAFHGSNNAMIRAVGDEAGSYFIITNTLYCLVAAFIVLKCKDTFFNKPAID